MVAFSSSALGGLRRAAKILRNLKTLDSKTKINNNKIKKFDMLKTNDRSQQLNILSFQI